MWESSFVKVSRDLDYELFPAPLAPSAVPLPSPPSPENGGERPQLLLLKSD